MPPHRFRESRRKPVSDLKRPRRRLGDTVRPLLNCPLCLQLGEKTNVIRWGEHTTRFECRRCGLRFSIDLGQLARTLIKPTSPRAFESIAGMFFPLLLEEKTSALADGEAEWIGEQIERLRHVKPT